MNDSELDMICKKNLDKKYYFLAEKSFCKDDRPYLFFSSIFVFLYSISAGAGSWEQRAASYATIQSTIVRDDDTGAASGSRNLSTPHPIREEHTLRYSGEGGQYPTRPRYQLMN